MLSNRHGRQRVTYRKGIAMRQKPYSKFKTENLVLRDLLAIDRTFLANERTLLAYVRTALTLLISGVGVIGFFMDSLVFNVLGAFFIVSSAMVFIVGLYKFLKKKDHIERSIG